MSPIRIESEHTDKRGIKTRTVQSASYEFAVGVAEAVKILGIPRSTLLRYDGGDIQRVNAGKRGGSIQRVYTDRALLRIALEAGRADIHRDEGTGLVELKAKNCKTLLNIPHEDLLDQ